MAEQPDEPIIRPFQGTPAIRGTRLTVYHIMDHYVANDPVEEVAEFYKLPVGDVVAAYAYIDEHKAEMMPEFEKMLERERRGNPPHIEAILAKSHEKLMRLKAELDRRHAGETGDARAAG
jgi:uncharacterized protein (DUF433 family)